MYGHNNVTQLLLDNGADIQIENDNGHNALEIAILYGNKDVAETILSSEHSRILSFPSPFNLLKLSLAFDLSFCFLNFQDQV